jgi:hypothetical protein
MSKTIRRTRAKKHNKSGRSNFVTYWVTNWTYDEEGLWKRIPLEGKEYDQAYWRFHSDRLKHLGNSKGSRHEAERNCRRKNKEELFRYFKDEDYEVMLHEPRCLSWDR